MEGLITGLRVSSSEFLVNIHIFIFLRSHHLESVCYILILYIFGYNNISRRHTTPPSQNLGSWPPNLQDWRLCDFPPVRCLPVEISCSFSPSVYLTSSIPSLLPSLHFVYPFFTSFTSLRLSLPSFFAPSTGLVFRRFLKPSQMNLFLWKTLKVHKIIRPKSLENTEIPIRRNVSSHAPACLPSFCLSLCLTACLSWSHSTLPYVYRMHAGSRQHWPGSSS